MKNKNERPTTKNPSSNRVLVFKIGAAKRPHVLTLEGRTLFSGDSVPVFGEEACITEAERRTEIYDLMTEDERKLFDKYCALRDE